MDRRADIWAFGAVLFEMLTARRAFEGETLSDTLASVLKTEPAWNALPTDVPLAIRRLLRLCLKKDPKARLRDIGEARRQLEEVIGGATVHPVARSSRRATDRGYRRCARAVRVARRQMDWLLGGERDQEGAD